MNGALGLATGLALYGLAADQDGGQKRKITENEQHAGLFHRNGCHDYGDRGVTKFGMPVSTHISLGAVFGVGFLRELLKVNYAKMEAVVFAGHQGEDRAEVEAYLQRFEAAEVREKKRMLAEMKRKKDMRDAAHGTSFAKNERKAFKKAYKKEIVKRSAVMRIVAAWIITVPATAVLAAVLYQIVASVLG
ncbi:MAG: inorganic phosphate transporter [Burkholderiaceae bacterium]